MCSILLLLILENFAKFTEKQLCQGLSQAYDYFQTDKTSHEVRSKFKEANEDKAFCKCGVTT